MGGNALQQQPREIARYPYFLDAQTLGKNALEVIAADLALKENLESLPARNGT
jgi:hypothetical protein